MGKPFGKISSHSDMRPPTDTQQNNASDTPRTEAALDGWTDRIVEESRLIPANAYAKVRENSRTLERQNNELVKALEAMLEANPTFSSKPIGAPDSEARLKQDAQIVAERMARAALAKASEA